MITTPNTRFGRHVSQDLADLSGQEIPGLGINRLASHYKQAIAERKARERANDNEFKLNVPHAHQVQQRIAEYLEEDAGRINGKLPVVSVFDALQVVKARKDLEKDAGLRALRGHLESMWKRKRTATITVSSYLKFRDHYARNFPKSAAVDVIVEIGQRGYATLPRKDLHHIASEIETQADYNRMIVKYGLSGPQPHQVKARKYILALLNDEEVDLPFEEVDPETGFTPSEGADVADWVVERERHQQRGGEPGEFREKNPPPKRKGPGPRGAQVDEDWGDEPQEDDVIISSTGALGSQSQVVFGGKYLGTFTEWDDIEDAIREEGNRGNFWPNIWQLSDHGNYHQVTDFDWDAPVREEREWDDPDDDDDESGREGHRQAQSGMDEFTRAYIEAAFWTSTDESDESGGRPMDENYGFQDLDEQSVQEIIQDCQKFQEENAADLEEFSELMSGKEWSGMEQAGHDFWLTRNGHGVGFWDRDAGEVGERLTKASEAFGEAYLFVNDDGTVGYDSTSIIQGKIDAEARDLEPEADDIPGREGHLSTETFSTRPTGVSDTGLARIAKSLRKTSQQDELFDEPEFQERPQEEIERDQRRSEGIFPIPQSVEKYVMDREGGGDIDYKEFVFGADPAAIMPGTPSMSDAELAVYIREYYADYAPDGLEGMSISEMADFLTESDIGIRDNTYNWTWWGPTVNFHLMGPAEEEPYAEGVLLMSLHHGGDVRGNYGLYEAFKVESYAEEAPWYRYMFTIYIKTNEGTITLDVEDDEAYYFYVARDETGTWNEGDNISSKDLNEKLNWEDSDLHDIW